MPTIRSANLVVSFDHSTQYADIRWCGNDRIVGSMQRARVLDRDAQEWTLFDTAGDKITECDKHGVREALRNFDGYMETIFPEAYDAIRDEIDSLTTHVSPS